MPKLTYADADGAPAEHVVRDAPVTIGRSAECDIRLTGDGVGRLHAVVELSDAKLRVRDQGSRDGTWVGDEKITDALLGDGDEFRVGDVSFKVTLGDASRRSASAGEGEEGAERERRVFKMPQREILGGIRLSKTQQVVIKIVCAVVILFCISVMFGLINIGFWKSGPVTYSHDTKIYVNQEDEPRKLIGEAVELARSARTAEHAGGTDVAFELITKAKESAEKALALIVALDDKHQGPTYWQLHNLRSEITTRASTINSEAFRLEMQVERAKAGGD